MGNLTSGELVLTTTSMVRTRSTIHKFREGVYTCLIATSVAEEGIDIPQCDLVVRFDLYNSMIQYVQSKGRARHRLSTYVNMAELGRREDDRKIKEAQHAAQRLRQFCAGVDRDRRVDLDDDDDDEEHKALARNGDKTDSLLAGEMHYKQHVIAETGARLTFLQSLEVLAAFVSSLEREHDTSPRAEYTVLPYGGTGGFISEVLLPESSPVRSTTGEPQLSKKAARCSAAFKMCRILIEKKYIDSYLRPTFSKKLPAMRNARLAVSSNKQSEYKMTIKPRMWSQLGTPEGLYGAVVILDNPDAIGRSSCPLVLLTRSPLPDLPGFPLYFGGSKESMLRIVSLPFRDSMAVTAEDIDQLAGYTLRMFRDVFSKWFEATVDQLPYVVAPSTLQHGYRYDVAGERRDLRDMIDWPALATVAAYDYLGWTADTPDAFFEDRFVIDQYDGSRKFFTRRVDHGMRPDSEVPAWVIAPRMRTWGRLARKTPMEYSNSVWDRYRYHKKWASDQRVVESELIALRRNLLDERQEERPDPTCWLVLEPLRVSAVSWETKHGRRGRALADFSLDHRRRGRHGARSSHHHLPHRVAPHRARRVRRAQPRHPARARARGHHQGQRQLGRARRGAGQPAGRHGRQLRAARVSRRHVSQDGDDDLALFAGAGRQRVRVPRRAHGHDLQQEPVQHGRRQAHPGAHSHVPV
jgi:endoribonuclease Dicer